MRMTEEQIKDKLVDISFEILKKGNRKVEMEWFTSEKDWKTTIIIEEIKQEEVIKS